MPARCVPRGALPSRLCAVRGAPKPNPKTDKAFTCPTPARPAAPDALDLRRAGRAGARCRRRCARRTTRAWRARCAFRRVMRRTASPSSCSTPTPAPCSSAQTQGACCYCVGFRCWRVENADDVNCMCRSDAFVAPLELTWTSPPLPPPALSPPPPAPVANAAAAAELLRCEEMTTAQRAARAGNPFTRLALADVQRQLSLADAVAVCRGIDTLLKQSEVQRRPSRGRTALRRPAEPSTQPGADAKAATPGTLPGSDAR